MDALDLVADKVRRTLGALDLDADEWTPFLLHLLGGPTDDRLAGLSPEAVSARTLEALVRMSVSASARQPLVMVVEDVHWIDRASEAYLASFAERLAGSRILLLLTYRSAERPGLMSAGLATQIALPPLTVDETAGIARSVFGAGRGRGGRPPRRRPGGRQSAVRGRADPRRRRERRRRSPRGPARGRGGVGASRNAPGTPHEPGSSASAPRKPSRRSPPPSATRSRSRCSRPWRRPIPRALAEALDRLAEAEVIVPEGSAGVDYRFRHALIRDAVYQSQGPALRHQAHARVARALEVTFPEQAAAHPELVALHLTEARQERAAIAWWVRGGTRARQRAAYAAAIEQLRRGLDLLPAALPPGPDRDRIELEIKVSLGISLQATLGFAAPEVGEIHARARELCRTVEGGPLLLGALGGLFLYYLYRSDFRSAREMAEQHLQVTEIIGARNRLCASYSALGYTAFQVGAPAEARAHFERSIELIDTYPRPEGTGLTPNNIGVASESMLALTLCLLGHREAAAVAIDGALARAERCPPGERAFSTAYALTLREPAAPDDGRAARGPALRAGGHADRPRARLRAHVGAGALADCAARIALGEGAADELAQALAAWRGRGLDLDAPYWLAAIAAGRRAAGRLDDARAMLDEAIAQMERHGERVHESELYRLRGELICGARRRRRRGGAPRSRARPRRRARPGRAPARAPGGGEPAPAPVRPGPARRLAARRIDREREDIAMTLPAYVLRGGELVFQVPYAARNATQFIFLLRADAARLAATFARDFGTPSGGAVEVRPAMGLVILSASRIPTIKSAAPPDSELGGGVSELEVAFLTVGIDVRRRRPVVCVPYLFVDSGMAVAAGRELFGLPKQHGFISIEGGRRPRASRWTRCRSSASIPRCRTPCIGSSTSRRSARCRVRWPSGRPSPRRPPGSRERSVKPGAWRRRRRRRPAASGRSSTRWRAPSTRSPTRGACSSPRSRTSSRGPSRSSGSSSSATSPSPIAPATRPSPTRR